MSIAVNLLNEIRMPVGPENLIFANFLKFTFNLNRICEKAKWQNFSCVLLFRIMVINFKAILKIAHWKKKKLKRGRELSSVIRIVELVWNKRANGVEELTHSRSKRERES
ncbi:hypothetical protein T07_13568 [Trichinella nelsoni]|uniref:Uncharacterized protein n=1 Tax=Trichinella nelsoni TaxID=6336 RepID=A0A0V0RI82_9BILA|nr:hypothetical protein T07_13568 [Trichinella nelsoni]